MPTAKSTFVSVTLRSGFAIHEFGEAEVHDLDPLARRVRLDDHQVGRLQVAVDDPFVVRGLEHLAEFAHDAADPRGAHPPVFGEHAFEVHALHVLHDDARPERVVQAGVVEGDRAGVVEPGHQQRFALEAVAELGVGGDVLVHHLDDDLPAEVELPREIDPAHPAFAEEAPGFVATQKHAANHAQSRSGVRPGREVAVLHSTLEWKIDTGRRSCRAT